MSGHPCFSSSFHVFLNSYVPIENVMKTPQFWMGFTMLGCLATSGLAGLDKKRKKKTISFFLAVASVAKTLMLDIFRPGLPGLVTAGFASGYVMALSIANLSGLSIDFLSVPVKEFSFRSSGLELRV